MPSTFAHRKFGQDVLSLITNEEIKNIILKNEQLYKIGLHGPDILFYYHPLFRNHINSIGFDMHSRPSKEFFERTKASLDTATDFKAMLAYIFGFVCHFSLDSACHSFVEYEINKDHFAHTEIETAFDKYLMEYDGLSPKTFNPTNHIVVSDKNSEVIGEVFNLKPKKIKKSLKSMYFYNTLLLPSNPFLDFFVALGIKMTGNWGDMHGLLIGSLDVTPFTFSTNYLYKLYKEGLKAAVKLIENYYNYIIGKEELSPLFNDTFGPNKEKMQSYADLLLD